MNTTLLASDQSIEKAVAGLRERNVESLVVDSGAEALEAVKKLIPAGASVMTGSSRTLDEIGFTDYLKSGPHGWNNLRAAILAEKDPAKQAELRKHSAISDYYLGSVHGLAETGEFVVLSASGSQLPHLVFTSPNLILVAGTQKIMPTLEEARKRAQEYVFPLEDERMKSTGAPGSVIAKEFIFHREATFTGRKITMVLVKERLGF